MPPKTKLMVLSLIVLLLMVLFLFTGVKGNWDYVIPKRGEKLLAIMLAGAAVPISTVVFQTLTNNRILTPGMIGLESLYLLIQTFIVFALGSTTLTMMNPNLHFFLSTGGMVLFAALLYRFLFQREGQHLYYLLLIGMIAGTFFQSVTSFMQFLIDPNEFFIIQDRMFASFNNIKTELLLPAFAIAGLAAIGSRKWFKYLDVLSLGKEHAINLGVPHDLVVKRLLFLISVLVSVSTALVGPITFLGLLVANVAYQFFRTHRHMYLIPGSVLISLIALTGGQMLVERVFAFSAPLSVVLNFIGGTYFLYLLLKERKRW